jgi:segregation and condensation protein A
MPLAPSLAAPAPTVRLPLTPSGPAFEGPLDLLLHLVRAGRMDIFDLPVATLCDQYLEHLRAMESLDLTVAGEFFVMAATLLEIKSRLLLPAPPKPESDDPEADAAQAGDDPRAELVRRLLEYSRYQAIAELLQGHEGERARTFFRDTATYTPEFHQPPRFGEMSADALLAALNRLLSDVGAGERAVTSVRRQKITLRMTMRLVLHHAEASGGAGIPLSDLLPERPCPLLEIVLLFLAVLELLKQGAIAVTQDTFCGALHLHFIPLAAREEIAA